MEEAATIRTAAARADGPFAGERWAAVGCWKKGERHCEPEGERLSKYRGHRAGREEDLSPGALEARGHGVPSVFEIADHTSRSFGVISRLVYWKIRRISGTLG